MTAPVAAPPAPRRGSRIGRTLAILAVGGMVAMWGYVLYLAFGPGRADPPDRLDHPTFARDAEAVCSAALDRIATLPLALEAETARARAEVLETANQHLARMLDELEELRPRGEEGDLVGAWLSDWHTYLRDREAYAAALRRDPDARLLVTSKGGDQITDYLDAFAQDNRMPACGTPADAS